MADFSATDGASRFVLTNATIPAALLQQSDLSTPLHDDELVLVDMAVAEGCVAALAPAGGGVAVDKSILPVIDLDRGMILPTLVDCHTHLDKGHIWPRSANPDGSFDGAINVVRQDRALAWSAGDLRARMDFSLRSAYAHGTAAIRTHIDSLPPQDEISWPVLRELMEDWKDRIALHGSSLFGMDRLDEDDQYLQRIADRVREANGVLGVMPYMIPRLDEHLDAIMLAAETRGLDLDFHVDETANPQARTLRHIAQAAIRNGFSGNILCGHCCSLAHQQPDEIDTTLDLVAKANLAVVSLPMCNMYLQGRINTGDTPGTPRWRGITLLHEMKARGIRVMVASDNTRDPFHPFGDLDMIEVFTQATRIAHFDHPPSDWIRAVTTTPADILRQPQKGRITLGGSADFIVFSGRDLFEIMARPGAQRQVFRDGQRIDTTPPDYRELDDLMGKRG